MSSKGPALGKEDALMTMIMMAKLLPYISALFSSATANGFQMVVNGPQAKVKHDFKVANIQGKLSGFGIEEQLPTIAIVAHYDSYGVAPVSCELFGDGRVCINQCGNRGVSAGKTVGFSIKTCLYSSLPLSTLTYLNHPPLLR